MATDAYKNGGVIFLLWDEGAGTLGGAATTRRSSSSRRSRRAGMVSKVQYDTTSYLKTVQNILGVDKLPCAADPGSVSTMFDLFATSL